MLPLTQSEQLLLKLAATGDPKIYNYLNQPIWREIGIALVHGDFLIIHADDVEYHSVELGVNGETYVEYHKLV